MQVKIDFNVSYQLSKQILSVETKWIKTKLESYEISQLFVLLKQTLVYS